MKQTRRRVTNARKQKSRERVAHGFLQELQIQAKKDRERYCAHGLEVRNRLSVFYLLQATGAIRQGTIRDSAGAKSSFHKRVAHHQEIRLPFFRMPKFTTREKEKSRKRVLNY
jgi:hypothetical protein